jgi:hypothetical protein
LHGDLEHPSSLVLTESDYDEFLDRRPLFATWLANQLISKTGVLIGYSLDDPDFRAVLSWIRARLGRVAPDLYVFEVDADPAKIDRYERRGVRVINLQSKNRGWAQLERVVRAVGRDRVLIVTLSDTSGSADNYRWRLQRPSVPGDWRVFSSQLVGLIQEQRRSLTGPQQGTVAGIRTLFDSDQFQVAFLSGVVELEGRLNRLLPARDLDPKTFRGRPASLRNLLELATDSGLLAISADDIARLTDARNRVVHGQDLQPSTLRSLTELVLNLLTQLPED